MKWVSTHSKCSSTVRSTVTLARLTNEIKSFINVRHLTAMFLPGLRRSFDETDSGRVFSPSSS